jgi:hypothetical protein
MLADAEVQVAATVIVRLEVTGVGKGQACLGGPSQIGGAKISHGRCCAMAFSTRPEESRVNMPFGSAASSGLPDPTQPAARAPALRHVADAETHGEPAALCSRLVDQGLWIDRDYQRHFVRYLSKLRLKGRSTLRTGWHEVGGRSIFQLPGETIGPRDAEPVILNAAALAGYMGGSLHLRR